MIKANELRIGIWTKWQNNNQEFDIKLEHLLNPDFWPHIDAGHIIGIPLTEEWLEKQGFKKDAYYKTRVAGKDSKTISVRWNESIDPEEHGWIVNNDRSDAWCYFITSVQYVHQLQNLFFALTGEELAIR